MEVSTIVAMQGYIYHIFPYHRVIFLTAPHPCSVPKSKKKIQHLRVSFPQLVNSVENLPWLTFRLLTNLPIMLMWMIFLLIIITIII